MALYSNKYPNTVRTVVGTAALFPDDMIVLCDTSSGAVNLTLLEIPQNYWNTLWKLYVLDNNNNAATNNITITAPAGQSINLTSSVVINTNGGGYVFEISGNGSYLGTPTSGGGGGGGGGVSSVSVTSPITNTGSPSVPNIGIAAANGTTNGYLTSFDWNTFSQKSPAIATLNNAVLKTATTTSIDYNTEFTVTNTGGATSVALTKNFPDVAKNSVAIVSDSNNINFNSNFDVTASVTPNKVNIAISSGTWTDLVGFEHQKTITTVQFPQCRVIGNLLYFRGTAIIPLASDLAGTTYVPPSSTTLIYASDPHPFVFQGTSGLVKGCLISGILNKSIEFNLGNSVVPPSVNFTVGSPTSTGWKIYNRGVETLPTRGTLISTIGKLELDNSGLLRFLPYNYAEVTWTSDPNSKGTGRLLTGMVNQGEIAVDFTQINNFPIIGTSISATHSTGTTDPNWSNFAPAKRTASYTIQNDIISAEANYLGGFMIELDGLIGFPV